MNATQISNTQDIIDSRDILERIADLRSEWAENTGDDPDDYVLTGDDWAVGLGEDGAAEMAALTSLVDALRNLGGDTPENGIPLVHEAYFEDYARELAEDIGAVDREAAWPLGYIDWEAAAAALLMDYSSVDFDGQTYWVRS